MQNIVNNNSTYHRFRWYATLENKTLAETLLKFPSIIRVIDMSDRNPPITATSMTFYVMLAVGDWWISIRLVDNTYDWRKFWKPFRECFVLQSRVSTKTVVTVSPWKHPAWKTSLYQTQKLVPKKHKKLLIC